MIPAHGHPQPHPQPQQGSLTLNIEPWSAVAIAKAAESQKWTGLLEVELVFGEESDNAWWCSCCTGGDPPVRTHSLVMTKQEMQAAKAAAPPHEELKEMPRILVQSLLQMCPLETLTLRTYTKPSITVRPTPATLFPGSPEETDWNLFGDMPRPEKEEDPYHEQNCINGCIDRVPPLKLLRMIDWPLSVGDLQQLSACFPYLERVVLERPHLSESCKEALEQWYSDRLPFIEWTDKVNSEEAQQPRYKHEKKDPHVYGCWLARNV